MGFLPGAVVVLAMCLTMLMAVGLFISSAIARPPMGELRPRRRSRKMPLWEVFSRPYAVKSPRRQRNPARAQPTH